MRRFALALALIAVLVLPASAAARGGTRTIAPPGNSGVSQYVETIPTAHGGRPTSSVHKGGSGSAHSQGGGGSGTSGGGGSAGGGTISSSTQRALDSQGAAGRAAAAFIQATAPSGVHTTKQGPGGGGNGAGAGGARAGSNNADASAGNGPSPANSVFHALTGSSSSGGLGSILPIVLVVSSLGLSTLAILRRKRTTS